MSEKVKVRQAVILAGGLNSRVMPFSKVIPKVMLPLGDKLVIQYLLEECIASGIRDVVMVVRDRYSIIKKFLEPDRELNRLLKDNGKEDIVEELKKLENLCNVKFVVQRIPKGEADGFNHARKHLANEDVAIILGDTVYKSLKPAIEQVIDDTDSKLSLMVGNARLVLTKNGLEKFNDRFKEKTGFKDLRIMDLYKMEEQEITRIQGDKIEVGSLDDFCCALGKMHG